MKRVSTIEGWDLRVPPEAMKRIGGMVRVINIGKCAWFPNPGDRLYKIGRWQGEVSEADFYVLRRSDGDTVYLKCIHPMDPPSVLVVLRDDRVPKWVLEAAAEVCEEPHVSSQGEE